MIPLRTDWTRGRRESNWQPAERPAWAPGSSALSFISGPSLQHLPSHHKLNVHVVSPQRATVATSKRWKTTRWFDLSDFTPSGKDKRRYFLVLLLLRSFVLKSENETLKPQFSHLGFFRRMSDRRLLSMRWRWEDETSKCNWKRISKLLLPWSRFLVNDEAQNDQCVLVIEPTFKVISKIRE